MSKDYTGGDAASCALMQQHKIDRLEADLAALRAELAKTQEHELNWAESSDRWCTKCGELRAENERLRAERNQLSHNLVTYGKHHKQDCL